MGKADQLGTPGLLDKRPVATPVTKGAVEGGIETFTEKSPIYLRNEIEAWLEKTKELRGTPTFIGEEEGGMPFTSYETAIAVVAKDYPFSNGPFTVRARYTKHY